MYAIVEKMDYWSLWWDGKHFVRNKNEAKLFATTDEAEKHIGEYISTDAPEDEEDYLFLSRLKVISYE